MKTAQQQARDKWNKNNPNYYKEYMKDYNAKLKADKLKRRKERLNLLLDDLTIDWEYVDGFNNKYIVSSNGDIINTVMWKIVQKTERDGYIYVMLDGRSKLVHRLVATAFISNPYNKSDVNHRNGIRSDNRVNNLEWMTHRENIQYSFDNLGRKSNLIGWRKKSK